MEPNFTKGGLVAFLSMATQKGLINTNTVAGLRAAVSRILDDVGDADDVRTIDVPTAIKRFNNRSPGVLSPSSLRVYERRLQRVIEQYVRYTDDPAGYAHPSRRAQKGAAERAPKPRRAPDLKVGASAESVLTQPAAAPIKTTPGLSLEFPMRPDFLAQVVVPRDMKYVEARRLSRFILTLAEDSPPDHD